jgi:hypothetical protein
MTPDMIVRIAREPSHPYPPQKNGEEVCKYDGEVYIVENSPIS